MEFSLSELEIFSKGTEVFMAILDRDGKTIKLNDKWSEKLKFNNKDFIGNSLSDFIHTNDKVKFDKALASSQENGSACHIVLRFIDESLHSFSFQIDFNFKNDEVYLVGFDITDHHKEHRSLQEMSKLAKIGAWYHDPIRDETFWSDEVYHIHDLPVGEPMNADKALGFYSMNDRDAINECVEKLYKDFEEYDFSGEIVTATGEKKWIRTQAKPTIHDGQIIFIYGVTADQSRLKTNVERLEFLSETQSMALKGIRSGLFDYDLVEGKVLLSYSFQEMLGLSKETESLTNKEFAEMIHPDDRSSATEDFFDGLEKEGNHFFNQFRIRHKDGKYKFYEVFGWRKKNENGVAVRMVGNLVNVDKKVKAQRERKRMLNSLEAMVDNGFIYSILLDLEGNVILADKRSLMVMVREYNVDPVSEQVKYKDVMPDIFKNSFQIEFDKALRGQTVRKEVERPLLEGAMQWLDIMYRPIKNEDNEIAYVLTNGMDITERKRAEFSIKEASNHAQSLNRLKSGILSNLSHEIRTPLNGIMGATELLAHLGLDEEGNELLDIQRDSSMRLMKTLTDMVALSDIDSMRDNMNLVSLSINEMMQICYEMYHHQANLRKLTFEVVKCELDPYAMVDKEMMISALSAIVNNALKFTNKGGVKISCELDEQEYAEIKVTDTGVGIPKESFERIFEDFEKGNEGLNYKYQGTGIGLSISKKFIQLMGGMIYVDSTLDKGTEFVIKIPAASKT
ncbi:MAG: PAS domain-containing protein [Ekhidna sp.]